MSAKVTVDLPHCDQVDDDGQVYFDGYAIRADCTGSPQHRRIYVPDLGVDLSPARARALAAALLAAAEVVER